MRMGQDEAGEVRPLLLDEAQVGQDDVDAGVVLALGEGDAEIDHQPLARVGGPEAVEIAVHADLADAAERHEHELARRGALRVGHQPRSSGAMRASVTSPKVSLRRWPCASRISSAPPSSRPRKLPAMRSRPVSTVRLSPTAPRVSEPGGTHGGEAGTAVPCPEPALHRLRQKAQHRLRRRHSRRALQDGSRPGRAPSGATPD